MLQVAQVAVCSQINTKHVNTVCAEGTVVIQRPSTYRAVNTYHLGYKNQSVYAVSGTSRFLFSDKYKTHKYSVGRAYSCYLKTQYVPRCKHFSSRL